MNKNDILYFKLLAMSAVIFLFSIAWDLSTIASPVK